MDAFTRHCHGTLAEWLKYDPVLAKGEMVLVATDPNKPDEYNSKKVGDGIRKFSQLPMLGFECLQTTGNSTLFPMSQDATTKAITEGAQAIITQDLTDDEDKVPSAAAIKGTITSEITGDEDKVPSGKAVGQAIADLGISDNLEFNSIVKELVFSPEPTVSQLEQISTALIYLNVQHPDSGLYMLGMQFVNNVGSVIFGEYKTSEDPFVITKEDCIFWINSIKAYVLWDKVASARTALGINLNNTRIGFACSPVLDRINKNQEIDSIKRDLAEPGISDNAGLNKIVKELILPLPDSQITQIGAFKLFKNYIHPSYGTYLLGLQVLNKNSEVIRSAYRQSETPFDMEKEDDIFRCNGIEAYVHWECLEQDSATFSNISLKPYALGEPASAVLALDRQGQELQSQRETIGGNVRFDSSNLSTGSVTFWQSDGTAMTNSYRRVSGMIKVEEGEVYEYKAYNYKSTLTIAAFDENRALLLEKSVSFSTYDGNSNVRRIYTVPRGVCYIQYQTSENSESDCYFRQVRGNTLLSRLSALEKKPAKTYPTKLSGFSTFEERADWTVSDDGTEAHTSVTGLTNVFSDTAASFSDEFNISATIVAEGAAFECVVGKGSALSGTLIGIKYDDSSGYVVGYNRQSATELSGQTTEPLTNVQLQSGKPVHMRIRKRVDSGSYYDVEIYDSQGKKDTFERFGESTTRPGDSAIGYGWGAACACMLSGNHMKVSNFSLGFPVHDELKLLCIGHSFMEGGSIPTQKDKRYVSIIGDEIGEGHFLVLAQGGATAGGVVKIIDNYARWFPNAKYALIHLGGNDCYYTPTAINISNCIRNCTYIKETLELADIKPVWVIDSGWVSNYQNGINEIADFSNWLLEQPLHVDARECFRTGDSNDSSKYLGDGIHPTPATHSAIANCIRAQAGYLFD